MKERKNAVLFGEKPMTLLGEEIKPGTKAPDFTVVAIDFTTKHWADLFHGKPALLSAVPSLNTGICDAETRRFDAEAARREGKVDMYTISMDLPFMQKNWCSSAKVSRLVTLSDHRDAAFGLAYGCLMKELRVLCRAVFVVDRQGIVRYVEYLPKIGQHPDYDRALAALDALH